MTGHEDLQAYKSHEFLGRGSFDKEIENDHWLSRSAVQCPRKIHIIRSICRDFGDYLRTELKQKQSVGAMNAPNCIL